MLFVSRIICLLSSRACSPLLNITAYNNLALTASRPDQPGSTGVIGDYTGDDILTPR